MKSFSSRSRGRPSDDQVAPAHWIEVFETCYGPFKRTLAALDATERAAFRADVLALLRSGNRSGDDTLVLPSEYLEVVIQRDG